MEIGTPNHIEVLLHCHCSPAPHPRFEYGAVSQAIVLFEKHGVITKGERPNTWKTTPKGDAWVRALCRVKKPRDAFVDENGNVL